MVAQAEHPAVMTNVRLPDQRMRTIDPKRKLERSYPKCLFLAGKRPFNVELAPICAISQCKTGGNAHVTKASILTVHVGHLALSQVNFDKY